MPVLAAYAAAHPPLIIPAVGRGRERDIQPTVDAYREVAARIAALAPETIVITSPHAAFWADWFHISPGAEACGSFAGFGAPEAAYRVAYDTELADEICAICEERGIAAGTAYERDAALDHATMIPVHFIEEELSDFKVVRIGLAGLPAEEHRRFGHAIAEAAERLGRRIVFVASGDLSHKLLKDGPYGFAPEGPAFDERVTADFARGDLDDLFAIDPSFADAAAECGLRSFQIMAGALDGCSFRSELLSYEGPFGVGYGIAAFTPEEDALVRLARASLASYVRDGVRMDPPSWTAPELAGTRAGCFISLKLDGRLRGCIGTIAPTRASLAEEICANAVSAAAFDPRFPPVAPAELDSLSVSVDVLGEAEPVSGLDELDPARYGVIVSTAEGRRGLLLPDLEGVDTVEEQVAIAARKGGIELGFEPVMLERFEVVRHR